MSDTVEYLLNHFEKNRDNYELCKELGLKMALAHGLGQFAYKPLERALEILPTTATGHEIVDLYAALGQSYMAAGDTLRAIEVLQEGLKIQPTAQALMSRLLEAYFAKSDHLNTSNTFKKLEKSFLEYAEQKKDSHSAPLTRLLYPSSVACIRFGELASKLDLYIKARILGIKDDCHAVFLAYDPAPINKTLYDYFKKTGRNFIEFVEDKESDEYFTKKFSGAIDHMDYYRLSDGEFYQRSFAMQTIQRLWEEQKRPPLIRINRKHKKDGQAVLKSFGLEEKDWFVTLHIRSSDTYKDQAGREEDNNNLVRDSVIEDYTTAVEAITNAGGWVIRIGDPNMAPFPKMERVIDYAHHELRADWLDLFLIANSKFLMCSNSGPAIVSTTLGTPIVAINWFPLHAWPYGMRDLLIHKTIRPIGTNKCLDLKTCCQYPFAGAHSQNVYRAAAVEVIPNTPEEILEVTKEAMDTFVHETPKIINKEKLALFEKYARLSDPANVGLNCRPGYHFLMNHLDLLDCEEADDAP